jgi:Flp pilus assembly protein TadB
MELPWIREYWALLGAAVAAAVALAAVGVALWRRSRRGRLGIRLREQRRRQRELDEAQKAWQQASRRLQKLEKRAGRVAPKALDEARGLLGDAERLVELRAGALKVAQNQVRMIIVEEYPPSRHDALRRRYGVPEHADARPFSFDG